MGSLDENAVVEEVHVKPESCNGNSDDDSVVKSEFSNSLFKSDVSDKSTNENEANEPSDFDRESGITNDINDDIETIYNEPDFDILNEPGVTDRPIKGFALGVLNPKILSWIDSKYKIEEGARTAVQEWIQNCHKKLY